jgi:DNA-binding response OmpR family regulator
VNDDLVWLNDDCLAILHCLAAQPGHIVSKEMLHDMIYTDKDGDLPELETITVLVHRLRRKLSPDDPELFIKTIRGSGYCLIEAHVT